MQKVFSNGLLHVYRPLHTNQCLLFGNLFLVGHNYKHNCPLYEVTLTKKNKTELFFVVVVRLFYFFIVVLYNQRSW